jgi:hypothetical protein
MLNNVQQERIFTGQHMPPSPQGCRYRHLDSETWWLTAVAVVGLVLPVNPAFGWGVGALAGHGLLMGSGPLAATQPVLQPASPREEPASPRDVTTAIKSKFRSTKLFTDSWYRDHPAAWRPASDATTAAALTSWDAVAEWLTVASDPVYYGYGDNVVVTDMEVHFSGLRAASLFDYAQAAAELAAAGAKEPAKTARWRSLGTFALVPPQRFNARAYVTLDVSRVGFVRGTYVDALTKQPVPVKGAVDRAYQRVAWTTGDKGTTVFDTGLDNLTRDAAPLLVHYETKRTEQWLTVRVPSDDGQDSPTTPPGEK